MIDSSKQLLDGDDLRVILADTVALLARHVEKVNSLNVFPVPDGDTGTNILLTLQDISKSASVVKSSSASDVSRAMAKGALMGARGNSGVILAQFFKGIAQGLAQKYSFGAADFAIALHTASDQAMKAVSEPVEGTMLTVMRDVAVAASGSTSANCNFGVMLESVCETARHTVQLSPTMLPVLREAGVVDAGGFAFQLILEAIKLYVTGSDIKSEVFAIPIPEGVTNPAGFVKPEFLDEAGQHQYGYCAQFLIQGSELNCEEIRKTISTLAKSVVVIGDESIVKVHAHTDNPDDIKLHGTSLGNLSQFSITSMDEQHVQYAHSRRESIYQKNESDVISAVAVVSGDGLSLLFEELGATVVRTRDHESLGVRELLGIVDATPNDEIIFLPNDKDIICPAQQMANLTKKLVSVVPSSSVPQGVAALLAFNPHEMYETNVSNMKLALDSVQTGEVSCVSKSTTLNGTAVKKGQFVGILDQQLVFAHEDHIKVMTALLEKASVGADDLVTLYKGESVSDTEIKLVSQAISHSYPETEVEVVDSGQTHCSYIVSIE